MYMYCDKCNDIIDIRSFKFVIKDGKSFLYCGNCSEKESEDMSVELGKEISEKQ